MNRSRCLRRVIGRRAQTVIAGLSIFCLTLSLTSTLVPRPAAAASTATPRYAINAGGDDVVPYAEDARFDGGTTSSTRNPISTGSQYDAAPPAVYQTERHGQFSYTLDGLTGGARYTLRLHFAEIQHDSAGRRQFDVAVNGTTVLDDFDVFAYAGGRDRAVVRSANTLANAVGQVVVRFIAGAAGQPTVSGIELIPGFSYRVDAGAGEPAGEFTADGFFTGGRAESTGTHIDRSTVDSPAPAAVYQSIRSSQPHTSLRYEFPDLAAGARYHVRLHFAEISRATRVGDRVFDVSINDQLILDNFDALAAAGEPARAVTRQFFITATAGGTISVGFKAVSGRPMVSGVEVVPLRSYAVDAGGSGAAGWLPNGYVDRGSAVSYDGSVDTAGVTDPAPQAVYQTHHTGTAGTPRFTYTFNGFLPGSIYRVRLHFAENEKTAARQRVFDISLNDTRTGGPPALALNDYDIFARAGVAHKAVVADLTAHADPAGRIAVGFHPVVGDPIVNGIEIVPEPDIPDGYHITDVGKLGTPNGVMVRDGKASALLGKGKDAKLLWTYGDTIMDGPAGPTANPPGATNWTNTGSVSEIRTPQIAAELVDTTTPPSPATDKPHAQLIPFNDQELAYTVDCWYDPPCANSPGGSSRYVIWPGGTISLWNGDVVVVGESNMNLWTAPCLFDCPPVGTIAATVKAGTIPGTAKRSPQLLFTYCERRYADGGIDDGKYAYLYRSLGSEQWDDCAAGTGNYQWNTVGTTWRSCGSPPLNKCTAVYDPPLYNFSTTTATGESTDDYATWQFIGNEVQFFAAKQPDAGGVEVSVLNADDEVVWGPETHDLHAPAYRGGQLVTTATLASTGTYKLKVRPTGVAGAGGGTTVNIDYAISQDTIKPGARAYVARAPLSSVLDGSAYTVWNENCSCWDPDKSNATPMRGEWALLGIDDMGYNPYLGQYVATGTSFFTNEIVMHTAPTPRGPWTPKKLVARASNGTVVYSSGYHPEMNLSDGQTIYVTYSRGNENLLGDIRILQIILPPK